MTCVGNQGELLFDLHFRGSDTCGGGVEMPTREPGPSFLLFPDGGSALTSISEVLPLGVPCLFFP